VVAARPLVALLLVGAAIVGLSGCARDARATEMGTVGDSFVVPVNASDGKVRVSVTELVAVSDSDAEEWDLQGVADQYNVGERPSDPIFYFIHYSLEQVEGELPPQTPRLWVLSTANETLYRSYFMLPPDEAGCSGTLGDDGSGCTVVMVPRGTGITMVRYYGVDEWHNRSGMGSDYWAGWTLE